MNVVYTSRFEIHSLQDLRDKLRLHAENFWRVKFKDPDASFRLMPDVDKTLDLFPPDNKDIFKQNNEPLIF